MYIKLSSKTPKNFKINEVISLSLNHDQEIKDIQVIDNNRILILIEDEEIQGIIFDIDNQKIIHRIKK